MQYCTIAEAFPTPSGVGHRCIDTERLLPGVSPQVLDFLMRQTRVVSVASLACHENSTTFFQCPMLYPLLGWARVECSTPVAGVASLQRVCYFVAPPVRPAACAENNHCFPESSQ